ncbi:plasma-membrane choline transporter-domain-containing protein [Gongronella butleri]|nr:plasma-membrane choline transporter-domain-containing protein [Gongronella butleri]
MDQSLPNLAKSVFSTLRQSILEPPAWRSAYAQMEAESENEDDDGDHGYRQTHLHATQPSESLFYSTQQPGPGEESIPLTDSMGHYSDRSQLIFSQDDLESTVEESPKPSAIYLDIPSTQATTSQAPKPLSESLLPTTAAIPMAITSDTKTERKHRDPAFAMLYAACMAIYLISALIILFTTSANAIEKYAKGSTFATIRDSAGMLTLMMALAIAGGAIWIFLLRTMTKVIVWGTLVLIPIAFAAMFIWSMAESLHKHVFYGGHGDEMQNTSLTVISFIPLLLSGVYAYLVTINRNRINKTIGIIELSCDVLRFNPGILVVSLLLMGAFIVFSIVWITLFNRLWLMGVSSGSVWLVSDNAYVWATYHIFIYLWTAAILINMQRFVLSAITAQWYFHRHEPQQLGSDHPWVIALQRASTTSFGTLAFGGLILSIVQLLHFMTRHMKKYTKTGWPFVTLVSALLAYIEALISNINNYVIGLAGITGDGFCMSAKAGTKIFRRNLISGLVGDLITRLILYIGSLVVSIASGLAAYMFASHQLHSSHGYVVGMIAALAPLYISQFFSYTLMSVVDATFLCYAIDLDTGSVHLSAAHEVFSGFD